MIYNKIERWAGIITTGLDRLPGAGRPGERRPRPDQPAVRRPGAQCPPRGEGIPGGAKGVADSGSRKRKRHLAHGHARSDLLSFSVNL